MIVHKLHLFWTFMRIGILNELAYRMNFFVQLLQSAINLITALAGFSIVFSHTENLGGWGKTREQQTAAVRAACEWLRQHRTVADMARQLRQAADRLEATA